MTVSNLLSIFSSKPRLDHPNAKKRLEALEALDSSKQDEFLRVVREDSDLTVRLTALEKISDPNKLVEFLGDNHLSDSIVEKLLPSMKPGDELLKNEQLAIAFISAKDDPDTLTELLEHIELSDHVVSSILSKSDTELKDKLISNLKSEAALSKFETVARESDRQTFKKIRERVVAIKEIQSELEEKLKHLDELRVAAAKLDETEARYNSLRDAHERRWSAAVGEVAQLNERLVSFGNTAIDVELERANFPERKSVEDRPKTAAPDFNRILNVFESSAKDLQAIEQAESDWLDGLKIERPDRELSDRFDSLVQVARSTIFQNEEAERLESRMQSLSRPFKFNEPKNRDDWNNLRNVKRNATKRRQAIEDFEQELIDAQIDATVRETWLGELASVKQECANAFQKCQDLEQKTEEILESQLQRLQKLTEEGVLSKAIPVEREVRNLIRRLPSNTAEQFKARLAPHSAQIVEYLKWRSFAVLPKRVELCEAIQKLAQTPLEPQKQAAEVKALRVQWNELGPVANAEEATLQEQYNAHAEEAYKVCKKWYDELDALKKTNLIERTKVCDELERYVEGNNWENPDWKAVSKTLRTAKEAYRTITPVDRTGIRTLDKRFRALTSRIHKRINNQFKENAKAKQELIDEVKAVYDNNELDQHEMLDQVKQIQAKWKTVGPANKKEQSLWDEFRGMCDLAYEAMNRARNERRESIDENIKKANDLVDQLARFVRETDASERQVLNTAFSNCNAGLKDLFLPKRIRQGIERKVSDIRGVVKQSVEKAQEQSKNSRLLELLDLDAQLAGCESNEEDIPDEWFETVGADSVLFETRLPDTAEEPLNDLVLRAEMSAKIVAKNEEDNQRRLVLRVEYLKENIGRGTEAREDTAERLIKEWVGIAHGEQSLRARFRQAIDVLLSNA